MAFGVLHALDIAGGMISALAALLLISLGTRVDVVMLWAIPPLIVSTGLLFFVRRTEVYLATTPLKQAGAPAQRSFADSRTLLVMLLASATFYGFSFYNLGFPILSAADHRATTYGFELGVLTYVIYLGISAASGYLIGAGQASPLRSLWLLGYLPSALGSGLIGLSALLQLHALTFYLFIVLLGLGMGGVETLEPTLVSSLVGATTLSRGMGFLTVSRSVGQFLSNLVMGILFSFSRSVPYFYACASASLAALILATAEARYRRAGTASQPAPPER